MKTFKVALVSALLTITGNAAAANYKFVAGDNHTGTKLCVEAGSNDLMGYRALMKEYHLKNKTIANKLQCNGENIANFAARYDAMRTATHINKYRKNRVSITDLAALSAKKKSQQDTVIITVN